MQKNLTTFTQLQKTLSGRRIANPVKQSLPEMSYVVQRKASVDSNFDAMMWLNKNVYVTEYKAPSQQYTNEARAITTMVMTADQHKKHG